MIAALYKRNIKTHGRLLLAFLAVLAMYFSVMVGMYNPRDNSIMEQLAAMKFSEQMLAAFGFTAPPPGLAGFLAGYLYNFLLLALPLALFVYLANKLVAALVDRGSMAVLLSTPHTRRAVAITQGAFLVSVVAVIVCFVTLLGLALGEYRFPGQMDTAAFLKLNGGLFLMLLTVSAISFFASCLLSLSRWSLSLGVGLPVVMLLVQMLKNASSGLTWLEYLTLFSLFRTDAFVTNATVWPDMAVLAAISVVLYGAGVVVFDRKDLPI